MPARIGARRMEAAHTRLKGGGGLVAGLDLDFVQGRYALDSPHASSLPTGWSYSRTGVATAETSSGQIVTFAPNVPRITDRGLLVEEARANVMLRADQPGQWTAGKTQAGIVVTRVGTGTENGWNYADYRFVGTAAGTVVDLGDVGGGSRTAATPGQVWTGYLYGRVVGGTTAGVTSARWSVIEESAGPTYAGQTDGTAFPLNGSVARSVATRTLGAGTAFTRAALLFYVTNGAAIDITLRLYGPQLEAGAFPTSYIPTTGAPVTRGADLVGMLGLASLLNETSPYTILVEALWTPQATTAFAFEGAQVAGNITGATLGTNSTGRRARSLHRSGANRSDGTEATERTTGQIARMAVTSEGRLAAFGGVIPSTAAPTQSNWSPDGIRIGHRSDALGSSPSGYWNNYIRRIRIRPSATTDNELSALTSAVNGWTESDGLDPMALFIGGVPGAWYDPSDLSTLFQDAAGTIPVTADGQFVGRILDKSGNGRHLTQGTSASRPVFREANGLRWLEGDGLDDWLQGSVSGWTALTSVIAYADPNTSINGAVTFEIAAAVRSNGLLQIDSGSPAAANARRAIVRGASFSQQASSTTTQALGAAVVRSIQARQDDFAFWQDGASTGTDNSGVWPNSPVASLSLFAGAGGVSFGTSRVFGLVVRAPQMTQGERQLVERFLASKSGVTLSA